MPPFHFEEARECVISRVLAGRKLPARDLVALENCAGRVLAEDIAADRDYPPLAKSIRDGFAVIASDLPGKLRVTGEVRAGNRFDGEVRSGEAVEIMTGAPLPRGADAVVMVEYVTRDGDEIRTDRQVNAGDFVNPQGAESRRGDTVLKAGETLAFPQVALLATIGRTAVPVYRKPRVVILATGDEIVETAETPLEHQIRNSNSYALAVQVRRAGGCPQILPVAPDSYAETRDLVERGLKQDLLLLSGGVSAGKYDIVEQVLADCGAEFFFDRVLIQPGQPLVFGRAQDTFFFGLPGNPASTMVTFEIFARSALELLAGQNEAALPLTLARLSREFRHKPGLTRFLPARLRGDGGDLTPVPWQGSSDVPALARANAFLVADADRESWNAGALIRVLLR